MDTNHGHLSFNYLVEKSGFEPQSHTQNSRSSLKEKAP